LSPFTGRTPLMCSQFYSWLLLESSEHRRAESLGKLKTTKSAPQLPQCQQSQPVVLACVLRILVVPVPILIIAQLYCASVASSDVLFETKVLVSKLFEDKNGSKVVFSVFS